MVDIAELVMGCFVELVDDLAQAKGLKKGDFAQKVWPDATPKANRARWLHIRTLAPKTGQPQGVLISDAYRMAEALNEDFALLMLRAKDLAFKKQAELDEQEKSKAGKRGG